MRASRLMLKLAACAALATVLVGALAGRRGEWTAKERETLRSLSLASLGPLPADPSNRVADDARAAALGERLFSDT
jgi:cytochrome c peroxidase